MGRNPQLDIFWGLLGVIFGTLLPAIFAFGKIADGVALSLTDALYLVIFVASLSAATALAATGFGRKSRHDRLLDEIRARPTVPLTAVVRLDYKPVED